MALPSLFQLLNPLMMLVFAAGFAIIYRYDRHSHRSARFFSLNYLFAASGFIVDFFRSFIPLVAASYASNLFYLGSMVFFVLGMCARYARPAPLKRVLLLCATTLAVNSWFLFISPSITARSLIISFGAASLAAIAAWTVRSAVKNRIDRIVFWIAVALAVQFVVRPIVVISLTGTTMTPENYLNSTYAVTLHFAVALIGLSMAGALFVAYGMDIVTSLNRRGETDHLTGILNRRGFEARAGQLLQLTVGNGTETAVIICDIDHFKSVNDRYGHATGDAVIAHMANIIMRLCPPNGLCGRLGGEEFAICLPRQTADMAKLWCEGARATLAGGGRGGLPAFTASFGAAMAGPGFSLNAALRSADEALYAAKAAGRDCVRLAISSNSGMNGSMPAAGELAGAATGY